MSLQDLPDRAYLQFARIGHALADPTRLRILNLLCQVERSVDDLAEMLGHSAPNTSAHLKALQQAHLIERRRDGRRVYYRMSGAPAVRLWLALRDTGLSELPDLREAMRDFADEPGLIADVDEAELLARVERGDVTLLDLRPAEEFAAGHIPKARSIPYDELEQRIGELDAGRTVIAYCRGPFCVAAIQCVQRLREHGLDARRLSSGIAEWVAAGWHVDRLVDRASNE